MVAIISLTILQDNKCVAILGTKCLRNIRWTCFSQNIAGIGFGLRRPSGNTDIRMYVSVRFPSTLTDWERRKATGGRCTRSATPNAKCTQRGGMPNAKGEYSHLSASPKCGKSAGRRIILTVRLFA
jgi:hypothetical protein